MRNYLLRLGWAHGDEEIIPTARAIELFSLEGIGKSPARFDMKKLDSLNGHYIREMDDAALTAEIVAFAERREPGRAIAEAARVKLRRAMSGLKARAKTLADLLDGAEFLFADGPRAPDSAAGAILTPAARARLGRLLAALDGTQWETAALEAAVRAFAEKEGVKLGDVAQPLRAALTGRTTSPPVFDVLAVLGRDESVSRIRPHAE
jgi:glutamyl-tRNA synthetase